MKTVNANPHLNTDLCANKQMKQVTRHGWNA